MVEQSVSLFYKEGNSDKEYHIQLVKESGGYVVNFQYGRRGSTMKPGSKTTSPVEKDEAVKIFSKLQNEKMAKGYTPSETGKVFTATLSEERISGILPQLLNPIEESEVEQYINDDNYLAQEKHDGERRLVQKNEDGVTGINRKGLTVSLDAGIEKSIKEIGIYDAEIVGDHLYVFDLLSLKGKDLRALPLEERLKELRKVKFGKNVTLSETAHTKSGKQAVLKAVKESNGEGIVFKLKTSKYVAGRPNKGGAHLKFKFWKSATFIVSNHTKGKNSIGLVVLDGKKEIDVGKCTIPTGTPLPPVSALVEVRYLYAYKGGAVFQPAYLGERKDLERAACTASQLVYKKETDDE
jgi:bifunctional non-homologous end joining protein LigD